MPATDASSSENLIVRARQGDEAALAALRALVLRDPSRVPAQVFVLEQTAVLDPLACDPQTRRDVWRDVPKFRPSNPLLAGRSFAEEALHWVGTIPSLRATFERAALAWYSQQEHRLLTDERLDRRTRAQIRRRIDRLLLAGHTVWANWVLETPPDDFGMFDRIVQRWLDSAIDMGEAAHFPAGWRDRFYAAEYAHGVFAQLPLPVLRFLGVTLKSGSLDNLPVSYASLEGPPDLANTRVAQLKLGFRFRASKSAS